MKIILNGALGKMGVEIRKLLTAENGLELAAGVDINADGNDPMIIKDITDYSGDADMIVDFSHHSCTKVLMNYAVKRKLPIIVATTGQTPEEKEMIYEAATKIPVFFSATMSLGVAMLADFARRAAALMPGADIEIVEKHHNQKLDAPSGTALMIPNEIKKSREDAEFVCGRSGHGKRTENEIGIHAIRMGGVVGEHDVLLCTPKETITLTHTANSRTLFAEGAVVAVKFLADKPAGIYNMYSIVGSDVK